MTQGFPLSPETTPTARAANLALSGKINSIGTVDLVIHAVTAETVLVNYFLSDQSVVVFDPMTPTAATELASGSMYVLAANRGDGTWTITHSASAGSVRTFAYAILG